MGSISFSFFHDFEGGANIYRAIKSDSTAALMSDVNFLCVKMTLASYSYHLMSKEAPVLVPTSTVAIAVAMEVVFASISTAGSCNNSCSTNSSSSIHVLAQKCL